MSNLNSSALLTFAPGVLALIHADLPTGPPLRPVIPRNTIFNVSRDTKDIANKITVLLNELSDKVTFQYCAYQYSWCCTYLSDGYHVQFYIRIYRYPKKHELYGNYYVEFQRMEGDRLPYMNIYNTCQDILTSTGSTGEPMDVPTYISEYPDKLFKTTVFDCSTVFNDMTI
jgi:hypothetical protein